jgi:uncharacterized membrane protein
VLTTGVFEFSGAAGLLWRLLRRAAGLGLLVLTILVTPVNVVCAATIRTVRHALLGTAIALAAANGATCIDCIK